MMRPRALASSATPHGHRGRRTRRPGPASPRRPGARARVRLQESDHCVSSLELTMGSPRSGGDDVPKPRPPGRLARDVRCLGFAISVHHPSGAACQIREMIGKSRPSAIGTSTEIAASAGAAATRSASGSSPSPGAKRPPRASATMASACVGAAPCTSQSCSAGDAARRCPRHVLRPAPVAEEMQSIDENAGIRAARRLDDAQVGVEGGDGRQPMFSRSTLMPTPAHRSHKARRSGRDGPPPVVAAYAEAPGAQRRRAFEHRGQGVRPKVGREDHEFDVVQRDAVVVEGGAHVARGRASVGSS